MVWLGLCAFASLVALAGVAIVLEAAVWTLHGHLGACLADAAQWTGTRVGPALPEEAVSYLAEPTCHWFRD